jgi:hypothetical protein
MISPTDERCCASLPTTGLRHLAELRANRDLRVKIAADRVWVYWPAGEDEILHQVLAIGGADLFFRRDGLWYRPEQRLPSFHVPDEKDTQALLAVLTPAPVQVEERRFSPLTRLSIGIVRDDRPRAATALRCRLSELACWADQATSLQLGSLQAAYCKEEVLLLGAKLPVLPGSTRFWGRSVFLPLGFCPIPSVPEAALHEALGLHPNEMGLLTSAGVEVIPRGVVQSLTRAGVRLAWREGV